MKRTANVVAAAFVNMKGEVLVAKRADDQSFPRQWEFPGGKIEEGETNLQALIREIREELGISVQNAVSLGTIFHAYDHLDVHLEVFVVQWRGDNVRLTEHSEIQWVPAKELARWPLAKADLPFVQRIQKYLDQSSSTNG